MRSGSDVVGAATIAPVGLYVIAFSVISERSAGSFHVPKSLAFALHRCHQSCVRLSARAAPVGLGNRRCEGNHVRQNARLWPAFKVNVATVVRSSPRSGTPDWNSTASGPAMAVIPTLQRCTHGTTRP